MDVKDYTIRNLAARIANDAIQLATIQAQLDMLTAKKEVEEDGGKFTSQTKDSLAKSN